MCSLLLNKEREQKFVSVNLQRVEVSQKGKFATFSPKDDSQIFSLLGQILVCIVISWELVSF